MAKEERKPYSTYDLLIKVTLMPYGYEIDIWDQHLPPQEEPHYFSCRDFGGTYEYGDDEAKLAEVTGAVLLDAMERVEPVLEKLEKDGNIVKKGKSDGKRKRTQ